MLTVIGLMPVQYALNFDLSGDRMAHLAAAAAQSAPLIEKYGDDENDVAVQAAQRLAGIVAGKSSPADIPAHQRSATRDNVYRIDMELQRAAGDKTASPQERADANRLRAELRTLVEYAPAWVRVLSAACLGLGTMIGYRRIVTTIGERIGNEHLTPAQGASAELVAAGLIGSAGFSGLPVSTTHIVTSGVAGTMVAAGAGIRRQIVSQIAIAWLLTLPATMLMAGGLFWLLH